MKAVKDALLIAWIKISPQFKRNPFMTILLTMISAFPLFFMFAFGLSSMLSSGVVGAMVSTIGLIGLLASLQDLSADRHLKNRDMIVAMPVHPLSYAIGVAIAPLLASIPGLLFYMAIAMWIGLLNPASVGWVLMALLLCWASLSTLGFMISTYMSKASMYTMNTLSSLLAFGFVFLPPVYYPEANLGSYHWVSFLFPTSNTASLIRTYLRLSALSSESIIAHWLILVGTTIVFMLAASLKARWRET